VDTSRVKVRKGAHTGSVLCLSDGRQRALYVSPGVNSTLAATDTDLSYVNRARALHVSSFVDDRQFQVLLELVGHLETGVKLSFAPGELYAARELTALEPVLARTDILFVNSTEMRQLTGLDITSGVEACISSGCRMVAVTLGSGMTLELANGDRVEATVYIRDAGNEHVVEPSDTTPVTDSTGAGDAFTAGFLYGWLNDKSALECGRLGESNGARGSLPTPNLLSQRYQQLYGGML
jgi:ribokinase